MTVCIPLAKCRYMTIIGAYAATLPAEDSVKDQFYAALHSALNAVPRSDKLFLMGDFNARVGADYSAWGDIIGKHGTGKLNSNGVCL